MSGFPSRLSRDTFGPTLRNAWPVENPEIHIPAPAFNTAFHQLAGLNVAHPVRAIVVAEYDGVSAMAVRYQGQAWNPNGVQAHPVVVRSAVGVYTVTFLSSYLDELGVAITTQLLGAFARSVAEVVVWTDRRDVYAWLDSSNPLIVNLTAWNPSTGAAADVPFMLEVA